MWKGYETTNILLSRNVSRVKISTYHHRETINHNTTGTRDLNCLSKCCNNSQVVENIIYDAYLRNLDKRN